MGGGPEPGTGGPESGTEGRDFGISGMEPGIFGADDGTLLLLLSTDFSLGIPPARISPN